MGKLVVEEDGMVLFLLLVIDCLGDFRMYVPKCSDGSMVASSDFA